MLFSIRNVAIAGLALLAASPISANPVPAAVEARAVTAQQVIENIQTLTTKSQALQDLATSVNLIDAPLPIIGQGPFSDIISGFTDIIATATAANAQMAGTQPFAAADVAVDVAAIADAFRTFVVTMNQALLDILIGRAGILQAAPLIGQPVAAVLRQLGGVVNAIVSVLVGMTEATANDIQSNANLLIATIATIATAIETDGGLRT